MKLIHGSIAISEICVFIPDSHPAFKYWNEFCRESFIDIVTTTEQLRKHSGDFLFLVSCTEIIRDDIRSKFKNCIVIHESELPKGRGWSPMAWQILDGKNEIPISAIRCSDPVDSGDIIKQSILRLDGTELADEIHHKSFSAKSKLAMAIVNESHDGRNDLKVTPQIGDPTYYRRRVPDDSELDAEKSIAEQFDLLRICEPRFPAFFRHRGCRYEITLKKVADDR